MATAAEIKDITKDLETQLTCSICNEIYTKPRTLPCLHTFCFECIQSWSDTCKNEGNILSCPHCRLPVQVQGGDVCNLPSSFQYSSLLELFNKMKTKADKQNLHKVNDAQKLIARRRKHTLNKYLNSYMALLELSDDNIRRIDEGITLAMKKVRRDTRRQMKILQDNEAAMIERLNDIRIRHKAANDEEKSKIDPNIEQALGLRNTCQQIEDLEIEEEQFNPEDLKRLLNVFKTLPSPKVASTFFKQSANYNSSVFYIPNPEVQDLRLGKIVERVTHPSQCSITSLFPARCGYINQFHIVTRDKNGDVCYTNKCSIDVQIQDIDGNDIPKNLTEFQTGRYIVKYKAEKPSPYKVVVAIGEHAIQNSPQNVRTIGDNAETAECLIS